MVEDVRQAKMTNANGRADRGRNKSSSKEVNCQRFGRDGVDSGRQGKTPKTIRLRCMTELSLWKPLFQMQGEDARIRTGMSARDPVER
jgi:hypothetical protein